MTILIYPNMNQMSVAEIWLDMTRDQQNLPSLTLSRAITPSVISQF